MTVPRHAIRMIKYVIIESYASLYIDREIACAYRVHGHVYMYNCVVVICFKPHFISIVDSKPVYILYTLCVYIVMLCVYSNYFSII